MTKRLLLWCWIALVYGCSCGYRSRIGEVDGSLDSRPDTLADALVSDATIDAVIPADCQGRLVTSSNGSSFLGWTWNGEFCEGVFGGGPASGETEFLYPTLHACENAFQRCSSAHWRLVPIAPSAINVLGGPCRIGRGMTASIEVEVTHDFCQRPGPIQAEFIPGDEAMPDTVVVSGFRWEMRGIDCPPVDENSVSSLSLPVHIPLNASEGRGINIAVGAILVNQGQFMTGRYDLTPRNVNVDDQYEPVDVSSTVGIGERCSLDRHCAFGAVCVAPYNIGAAACQDEGRCFALHQIDASGWPATSLHRAIDGAFCGNEDTRVALQSFAGGAPYQNVCRGAANEACGDCPFPGECRGTWCTLETRSTISSNTSCQFDYECPVAQSCVETIDGFERRCAYRVEAASQRCSPGSNDWGPFPVHSVGTTHLVPWTCQFVGE